MNVEVTMNGQSGEVVITIPDRSLGGARANVKLSTLDALQLWQQLNRYFLASPT